MQTGSLPTDLIEYWSKIFEEETMEDDRPIVMISNITTEIQDPITRWDVEIAFRGLKDSCPWLDGLSP